MTRYIIMTVFLLSCASLLGYLEFVNPSSGAVKAEFSTIHPDAKVQEVDLIFDTEPKRVLVYLIEYKLENREESFSEEFAMRQGWDLQWRWCSDQTDRKCE